MRCNCSPLIIFGMKIKNTKLDYQQGIYFNIKYARLFSPSYVIRNKLLSTDNDTSRDKFSLYRNRAQIVLYLNYILTFKFTGLLPNTLLYNHTSKYYRFMYTKDKFLNQGLEFRIVLIFSTSLTVNKHIL